MQTSFDVPLQMILTGIAALLHSHCRYKTGLPITSSYCQNHLHIIHVNGLARIKVPFPGSQIFVLVYITGFGYKLGESGSTKSVT
jgi:hypothetical protein